MELTWWQCRGDVYLCIVMTRHKKERKRTAYITPQKKQIVQLTTNIRHDTLRYITYCGVRSETSSFTCCSNVEIRPSFLGFIWNTTRPQFSLENSAENCLWVCPKQAVASVAARVVVYVFFDGYIVSPSQNSAYRPLSAEAQLDRVTAPLTSRNRVCCLVWSCSQ